MKIDFEKFKVDEAERSITFSCASTYAVDRYDDETDSQFKQILVINEESVNLDRLNNGAPVLLQHDQNEQIGVCDRAWIAGDKVFVTVRISATEQGEKIWRDILDGIRKNISIGYSISKYHQETIDNQLCRIIDRFSIFEVSFVSVPADPECGLRNYEGVNHGELDMGQKARNLKENHRNSTTSKTPKRAEAQGLSGIAEAEAKTEEGNTGVEDKQVKSNIGLDQMEEEKIEKAEVVEEKEEVQEDPIDLRGLCKRLDDLAEAVAELKKDEAEKAEEAEEAPEAENREEVEEAKEEIKEEVTEAPAEVKDEAEEEVKRVASIKQIGRDFGVPYEKVEKAITEKTSVRSFGEQIKNKTNLYIRKEKMNDFGKYLQGRSFDEPFTINEFRTGEWGGGAGEGGAPLMGKKTENLQMVLQRLMAVKGYRVITGAHHTVLIPVESTPMTVAQAASLTTSADNSAPTFANVELTPVKIVGRTVIQKDLLTQSIDDLESYVITALTREIAYKTEAYLISKLLAGAGKTITYSDLASLTWSDVLGFEASVAPFAINEPKWIMNGASRGILKGVAKNQYQTDFLCDSQNRMAGYEVLVSGCLPATDRQLVFGDLDKLTVAFYGNGGLDIIVDKYTLAASGAVAITASTVIGAGVTHGDAFAVGKIASSSSSSSN